MLFIAPSKKLWLLAVGLILAAGTFLIFWLQKRPSTPLVSVSSSGVGKLAVHEPGMYMLTPSDLEALGLPSDPVNLRLFNLGQPQPLWFSGQGDDFTLYFYGQPLDLPYTNENIFFLTIQGNELPAMIAISNSQTLTTLPFPLHLEENILYFPKAEPERTWYWKSLNAPKSDTYEFTLTHLAEGEGTLRASFFSSTEAANTDPDHHLRLIVNDTLIMGVYWDGRGGQLFEASLPPRILQGGLNKLTIELPGDTGAVVETVLLDWLEIQYPQRLTAENDRVAFTGTGARIALNGFRSPHVVFDLSLAGRRDVSPFEVQPSDSLQITTEAGHHYFAVGPNGFLQPVISPAQLTPELRIAQAAYIAVGPTDLLEPLQPLLDHRQSLGLTTLAIPIEAVYDQFGGGIAHPEAIRYFLKYAYENWETAPEYLLLVGDSTYDPRGFQASSNTNRVPSFFRFTFYGGETVSDIPFAQLDEDLLPDLAVGRIPARTPEQVKVVVDKTLAYERAVAPDNPTTSEAWARRILAIADGQEASFQGDAETFLGYFPEAYDAVLLTPPAGDTTAPAQIMKVLNEGVLLMSYFGHGSITMLGKDRIFSVEDGAALANGDMLPIMINITCLAGLFTHPEAESLTEVMLWNPVGGAVAALSATSLTTPGDQAFLSKAFVNALVQNPEATLGQLLLTAQRILPVENEGMREVMDTFLLFGDPALELP